MHKKECVNYFFSGVLQQQKHSSEWGKEVSEILTRGVSRPKSGHDAGNLIINNDVLAIFSYHNSLKKLYSLFFDYLPAVSQIKN